MVDLDTTRKKLNALTVALDEKGAAVAVSHLRQLLLALEGDSSAQKRAAADAQAGSDSPAGAEKAGGRVRWSVYETWWQGHGESFLNEMVALLNQPGSAALYSAFTAFCQDVALALQKAMQPYSREELIFWGNLFARLAPYEDWPELWLNLLLDVRDKLISAGFSVWWKAYGREAARSLRKQAEANQAQINSQLVSFASVCVDQLLHAIPVEVYQKPLQEDNIVTLFLEILIVTVPAQNNEIWPVLLERFPISKETAWNVRAPFLRHWQRVHASAFASPEVQGWLRRWLEVSWSDLDALLTLGLPANWSKIAITKVLESSCPLPPVVLRDLVTRYQPLFEEVLQNLILAPRTQQTAIDFLAFLTQQNYPNIAGLLGRLLTVCHSLANREEIAKLLWQAAPLSSQEIAPFLEIHCQELFARYELTETMRQLLTTYLSNFDLDYLDSDPTRNLLQRLWERRKYSVLRLPAALQQTVEGWYTIAQFLAHPQQADLRALKALESSTGLPPEARQKLSAKLVPRLVQLATSEKNLTLILYILGQGNEHQLLLNMARVAGTQFGQDQPPVRLAPYVRYILEESNSLASPQKEAFIDDGLQALFEHCEAKIVARAFPEPLWTQPLIIEWQRWTDRQRSDGLNQKLAAFRQAINECHFPQMMRAFDPAFERELSASERRLIALARQFAAACEANNDADIFTTYEALMQQSPNMRLTVKNVDRVKQAYAWKEAEARKASKSPKPGQAAQPATPSKPGNEPRLQLVLPFKVGETVQPAMPFKPEEAVQPATPSKPEEAARPRLPLKTIEFPSVGAPPKPVPPVRTPYVNPVQPAQEPAASAQPVATVNGVAISVEEFEWVERLKLPYLQNKARDLQEKMQNLEIRGVQRDKKAVWLLRKEMRTIQKIIDYPVKYRRSVLDDLINDVFIREEIERCRPAERVWWEEFERRIDDEAASLHQKLQAYTGNSNSYLSKTDAETIKAIRCTLCVFVRLEYFVEYLQQKYQIEDIRDWLRSQEKRFRPEINVNQQFSTFR